MFNRRRGERFVDQGAISAWLSSEIQFDVPKAASKQSMDTIHNRFREERTKYSTEWNKAETMYNSRKGKIENANKGMPSIPTECHIALIAYTLETPLYKNFNEKSRHLSSINEWNSFPYQCFYSFLLHALKGVKSDPSTSHTLWRGVSKKFPTVDKNTTYHFNQFSSFSTDKAVAQDFASSEGTLKCFEPRPYAALGLKNYSEFPEEEEVLIYPWSTFRFTSVNTNVQPNEVHLHSYGSKQNGLPYNDQHFEDDLFFYRETDNYNYYSKL